MASTKLNSLPSLAADLFRPAIVEAKLMTAKHARDTVYVATLAEELSIIDTKLCAMEEALQVDTPHGPEAASSRPCRMPEAGPDANWIREKSGELDRRLRRIEQNSLLNSAHRHGNESQQKEGARKGRPLA
jgi:hypothetical protein